MNSSRPGTALAKPQEPIRVLCLHGHRTNAQVMRNQTKGLRAVLDERAEFVFLDAPGLARGPTDPIIEQHHAQDAPFYEWWAVRSVLPSDNVPVDQETEWTLFHEHIDESLTFVDRKLRELGPFDVVVGFSQGAVLLTLLSMRYLELENRRWWKLCICVGGVRLRAINHRHHFRGPHGQDLLVPFPSIHIIGQQDPLREEGLALAAMYDDHPTVAFQKAPLGKQVIFHDGGHKFPSAHRHQDLYQRLAEMIVAHCGLVARL